MATPAAPTAAAPEPAAGEAAAGEAPAGEAAGAGEEEAWGCLSEYKQAPLVTEADVSHTLLSLESYTTITRLGPAPETPSLNALLRPMRYVAVVVVCRDVTEYEPDGMHTFDTLPVPGLLASGEMLTVLMQSLVSPGQVPVALVKSPWMVHGPSMTPALVLPSRAANARTANFNIVPASFML